MRLKMEPGTNTNAGGRKPPTSNSSTVKGKRGLAQGLSTLSTATAVRMAQPPRPLLGGGGRGGSPTPSLLSNRSGRSVNELLRDVRDLAQSQRGSPAGSVIIPPTSGVEEPFTEEQVAEYTLAVRNKLRAQEASSSSSSFSTVIPSASLKSPLVSNAKARLRDKITAEYHEEQAKERSERFDTSVHDGEEEGSEDGIPQAHSSSSSSSSLFSGMLMGRSMPVNYDEDADLAQSEDNDAFLSGKEFTGSMKDNKTKLVATIGKLRERIFNMETGDSHGMPEELTAMKRENARLIADNLEMARHLERQQADAARSSQPKHSPPKAAGGRTPDQGTLRNLHAAAGGAGGGDDDEDNSSVFSGASRRSARDELGRQLGAHAHGGPPGIRDIRGIQEDGLSQLSSGSTDISDRRLAMFALVKTETGGLSRNMKIISNHQYDCMIRKPGGLLLPSFDGSVSAREYQKPGADRERANCLPVMTRPEVPPFHGEDSYLQANAVPTGTVQSVLEMVREHIKAYSTSTMHELLTHGPESEFEALHAKLLGEELILYHENIATAANFMGIGDKEPRHCHCVTRTFSFYKWHEMRWRKYVIDNVCLLPTRLDETSRKELESTTNWINETFDDSLRQGPTREQLEKVTVPTFFLALRVLCYCCEYCGTLGCVGSICRTKACTEVDNSKQSLVTWTAAKDKALAKAIADNAKVSGSTPLTGPQKAAAVNAWVASSPANTKPAAATRMTAEFLMENQHLIRLPIVTVLKF